MSRTMKKFDTYQNLCAQFYDLSKPTAPQDAYTFYKSYVAQAKGAILEPMCGTGRFLLPLLQDGFQVDGFDASEYMLHALRVRAKTLGLKPHVWQSYVESVRSKRLYHLIFIPSGSFGLITDTRAANKALKTFYDMLDHSGTLVFEVETFKAAADQFGLPRSSMYKRHDGTMILGTFFDLPPNDHVSTSICRYELVENHEIVKTEVEEFKVRLYDPEVLVHELKTVGFSEVNLLKTFHRQDPPRENDTVVIYECKKS